MAFTDDELKRYKAKASRSNTYTNQDCDMALAMIARLEASEADRDRWSGSACRLEARLTEVEGLARRMAEALSVSRGQWIHSVNKERCLEALAAFLAAYGESK